MEAVACKTKGEASHICCVQDMIAIDVGSVSAHNHFSALP